MIKPGTRVRNNPCKSCPFAGKNPVLLREERYSEMLGKVISNDSYHLCHSDSTSHTICNGSQTVAVRIWYVLGLIPEPTFESWYETVSKKGTWNPNIIPPK